MTTASHDRMWDLYTAADAADVLAIPGVTGALIRKWASRGHLTPAGLSERGRWPMYRLGDILAVERQQRLARRGRRASGLAVQACGNGVRPPRS